MPHAVLDGGLEVAELRALNALFDAYHDADHPPPGGLAANMDRLVAWASDPKLDGKYGNTAFALIAATGKASCLKPFAATSCPRSARARTIAPPIPPAPPVTTAVGCISQARC